MSESGAVRFGLAERVITPRHEVELYRFGSAPRTSRRVLDDLKAKVLVLEDECLQRVAIVSLDLIWLSRELCTAVRDLVCSEFGLRPESVLFAATHTHSSPQIRPATFNGVRRDHQYEEYLAVQVRDCMIAAVGSLRTGSIRIATVNSDAAVYRRKRVVDPAGLKRFRFCGRIKNRPEPRVQHDKIMSALWIYENGGDPAGVVLNLACHPSLFRDEGVSADFPGRVENKLRGCFEPAVTTLFLQGFAGNLRPNLVYRFPLSLKKPLQSAYHALFDPILFVRNARETDIDAFASRLVEELLSAETEPVKDVHLGGAWEEICLPLEPLPSREAFLSLTRSRETEIRAYGEHFAENYNSHTTIPFMLQCISLSPGFAIVALEGEVFMEYSIWLRKLAASMDLKVMPVGCANGMAGYIPDARSLDLGGYETDRTLILYGLPARFSAEIEDLIKKAVQNLLIRTYSAERPEGKHSILRLLADRPI